MTRHVLRPPTDSPPRPEVCGGEPAVAYLGLGSNTGDRLANLRDAVTRIAKLAPVTVVRQISDVYESPHMGLLPQDEGNRPPHFNIVIEVETTATPEGLLASLQQIEDQGGRVRTERWGSRTIDIDILVFGRERRSEPGLVLPHPGLEKRAFVLAPLEEIAPELTLMGGTPSSVLQGLLAAGQKVERKECHEVLL